MEITHKIKLDSGKEIELSESEFEEMKSKFSEIVKQPYFIPYVPDPWPNYPHYPFPNYPWYTVTCSDNSSTSVVV